MSRLSAANRLRAPFVMNGMRVGILGGTFNPPHDGHRDVSLGALAQLGLDRVWWLVTPGNPLKDNAALAALDRRLDACVSTADHPRIDVTGFEATLGTSFTSEMLGHLAARFAGVHFVWIMGADNLASFHRWRDWLGIARTFPMAVADRPGWRYRALGSVAAKRLERFRVPVEQARGLASMQPPAWTMLHAPLNPQSSTQLRQIAASQGVDPFSLNGQ